MEAKRSLPCSQELNVRTTKKKKKQKYIGVCWPIATTICKALHGKVVFFFPRFSVQSDEMHTEESSATPQTSDCQRVLRHSLLHTQLLVRPFGMESRKVKLLQISCFSVCLNKTPKSLCAAS